MLKEALQYIVSLEKPEIVDVEGRTYATKELCEVLEPECKPMKAKSLKSITGYIKHGIDNEWRADRLIVEIASPTTVAVRSELFGQNKQRETYLTASPDLPVLNFEYWYDTEQFIIAMQSMFCETEDRNILLKVVGNIKDETVKNISDDGVSQAVTVKTGVASVGEAKVPNPVILKPYRTFREIEQPESKFIFRMREGGRCALFGADGGAWRDEAVNRIATFLRKELSAELEAGSVIIMQ